MPKAMNPNSRYEVVLACDKDKPSPPTFIYPFLTGLQQMEMMELYESVDGQNVRAENMRTAFKLAGMFLRGWKNVTDPAGEPIPFDVEKLPAICSVIEAMELAQDVMFNQALDVTDKKKLDSPLGSGTAPSANPAPA